MIESIIVEISYHLGDPSTIIILATIWKTLATTRLGRVGADFFSEPLPERSLRDAFRSPILRVNSYEFRYIQQFDFYAPLVQQADRQGIAVGPAFGDLHSSENGENDIADYDGDYGRDGNDQSDDGDRQQSGHERVDRH